MFECHVTPLSIAQKMVWYLEIEEESKILEPQAGTGNLVQAILSEGHSLKNTTAIERHCDLANVIDVRFKDSKGLKIINSCFLGYTKEDAAPRFDRVLMNPPFRKTRQHIEAALSLLNPGGVLVALVPVTFKHEDAIELEELPNDTFPTAKVFTKIIRIDG